MTKRELIQAIAAKAGLTNAQAEAALLQQLGEAGVAVFERGSASAPGLAPRVEHHVGVPPVGAGLTRTHAHDARLLARGVAHDRGRRDGVVPLAPHDGPHGKDLAHHGFRGPTARDGGCDVVDGNAVSHSAAPFTLVRDGFPPKP